MKYNKIRFKKIYLKIIFNKLFHKIYKNNFYMMSLFKRINKKNM